MKTFLSLSAILRCMRSAIRFGVDPRNAADVQARKYTRAWSDKLRRSRVEKPFTFGVDAPSYFQYMQER